MHYLYKITDILNNKVYVGQSNKETERWRQHKYFAQRGKPIQYIHRAIIKYGIENFIYEVIAVCKTQEDADEIETQLIKQHNSRNRKYGYNRAPGGGVISWNKGLPQEQQPMFGKKHTEESKKKISEAQIGIPRKPHSEETKKKLSFIRIGKLHTTETKNKMLKAKSGDKSHFAKLNWDIVTKIRTDYTIGQFTYLELGEKYGITSSNVCRIVKNKTWRV